MQLQAIIQVFVAATLTASGVNAGFHDQAVYAKDIAPGQLQRIASYRAEKGGSLSVAQTSVLDKAENIVKNFAVNEIDALKADCDAVFGHEECINVLAGGRVGGEAKRSLLGKRVLCDCTDEDDYCIEGYHCQYKADNCGFYSKFRTICLGFLTSSPENWMGQVAGS
jgi:hypothetical protein